MGTCQATNPAHILSPPQGRRREVPHSQCREDGSRRIGRRVAEEQYVWDGPPFTYSWFSGNHILSVRHPMHMLVLQRTTCSIRAATLASEAATLELASTRGDW